MKGTYINAFITTRKIYRASRDDNLTMMIGKYRNITLKISMRFCLEADYRIDYML